MSTRIAVLMATLALAIPAGAVAQEAPCRPFTPQFVTKADAVQALHDNLDPFAGAERGLLTNIHTHRGGSFVFTGRADVDGPHQFIRLRWQVWAFANSTDCYLEVETTIVAIKNKHVAFDPPVSYPRVAGA